MRVNRFERYGIADLRADDGLAEVGKRIQVVMVQDAFGMGALRDCRDKQQVQQDHSFHGAVLFNTNDD
jgi:hypothetical protein